MAHEEARRLERAAGLILQWVRKADKNWQQYIDIALRENRLTPLEWIGAMLGYCLDNGLHMIVPKHPALDPNEPRIGEFRPCERCGNPVLIEIIGQRWHRRCPAEDQLTPGPPHAD